MPNQLRAARTGLALLALFAMVPMIPAADKPPEGKPDREGWKKLFDGKTLTGWKSADFYKPGKIHVKDGALILEKGSVDTSIRFWEGRKP